VTVFDNDHLPDGEHPALAGVRVTLYGRAGAVIAEATTPDTGRIAFATPADLADAEMTLRAEHPTFNRRTLRLDGTQTSPDIRKTLYRNLA
jgi:hypothetical protein